MGNIHFVKYLRVLFSVTYKLFGESRPAQLYISKKEYEVKLYYFYNNSSTTHDRLSVSPKIKHKTFGSAIQYNTENLDWKVYLKYALLYVGENPIVQQMQHRYHMLDARSTYIQP